MKPARGAGMTERNAGPLALSGNPSVIGLFFIPKEHILYDTPAGEELRHGAPRFASLRAVNAFLGYLRAQRERMAGQRGIKGVKRSELIEAHGYDTKYAMHAARLGRQGIEYAKTGRFTLPMPEPERSQIMAIRRGEIEESAALEYIARTEEELLQLRAENPAGLPESPSTDKIDMWLWGAYLVWWRCKEEAMRQEIHRQMEDSEGGLN